MAISRMQQPRQMYGLGSFVKKAVKGVTGAVKSIAKSDLGKAALLIGGGMYAGGLGPFAAAGRFGSIPGAGFASGIPSLIKGGVKALGLGVPAGGKPTLGQFGKVFALGSLGGAALEALTASGADEEELENIRDPETLRAYLRRGYKQLNPGAEPEQIEEFVTANTTEYAANGGRIGFADGMLSFEEAKAMNPGMFSAEVETDVVRPNTELLNYIKRIRDATEKGIIPMDFAMDLIKQKTMEQGVDLQDLRDDIMETQRIEQAYGGRIGFFKGAQADARAGRGAMSPGTSMSGGFRGGGDGGGNKDTTPKISEVVKNISNLSNVPAFEKISNLESRYGLGSSGLPSRARHMAAMNVLSNALSKTGLGVAMGIPSKLAGMLLVILNKML
jgi:hypothetical protein